MAEKRAKAFFTLNLPRKPKEGDSISVVAKLRENPKEFKVILGVKTVEDRNTSLEPHMAALEFKTEFVSEGVKVTTNWKTDTGWQGEEIIDSDWLDKTGIVNFKITFEKDALLLIDNTNSIITKFRLHFELERISRLQLWGNIKELRTIALKYNQKKVRRSPRKLE